MEFFPEVPGDDETQIVVARAQAGDDGAMEGLFERLHDHILLSVRLRLGPRLRSVLESRDIFQGVALEAFRDLKNFTPRGPGSYRYYLNRVILNNIRDRMRHFGALKRQGGELVSQSRLQDLPGKPADETYFDPSGRFERLEREISGLPEEMRQVLLMRSVDGLASKEVAEMLDKSDAAVRKLYSRAVAQLATRMGNEEPT
jgi:RNA polymerase sigma-70 factor (ECF subfamily)